MRNWSAIYSAPGGANGSEPNERLQPFDPIVTTVGCPTDAERGGSDPDSGAGLVRVAERVCSQPIPVRLDSKRTRPGREPEPEPRTRPGAGAGAGRPPPPFVLNFLYLNTMNFHPMANVGLNTFSYL